MATIKVTETLTAEEERALLVTEDSVASITKEAIQFVRNRLANAIEAAIKEKIKGQTLTQIEDRFRTR